MANRDYERNRRWREEDYSRDRDYPERPYYDRGYFDRNYYDRDYYGRTYGDRDYYGRSYADRDYYGRSYGDRDYYEERRFPPQSRGYETDYDNEYLDYGYDFWGTPYRDWTYGPYTGVGPRSYRRSDERIQDDVNDRLTWHGHVDATDIEVSVDDGVVTLRGSVDSRNEKRMAENVADSVIGVWDVNNNLTIRETGRWTGSGSTRETREGEIRQGMEVVGRNNGSVGEVKEVRANDFLVDRPMARDVYVPFSAGRAEGGRFRLNIEAGEVDNQGWEMPELIEEPS